MRMSRRFEGCRRNFWEIEGVDESAAGQPNQMATKNWQDWTHSNGVVEHTEEKALYPNSNTETH